jgi:hypothetical protein
MTGKKNKKFSYNAQKNVITFLESERADESINIQFGQKVQIFILLAMVQLLFFENFHGQIIT